MTPINHLHSARTNNQLEPPVAEMHSSMPSLDHAISILESGAVLHDWLPKEHPRAVIILQHGFAEYAEKYVHSYHNIILRFQEAEFRTLAIDQCGHGRALGDRGVVNVEHAVQDVLEVRKKALEGAIGLADRLPIFLFGHGLGGLITLGSALTDPRHIDGLILTAPALPLPMSSLATRTLDFTAKFLPNTPIPRVPSPVQGHSRQDNDAAHAFRDDPTSEKMQIPFIVAATAARVANKVWDMASTCNVPILILHGTDDVHTDPAGSKRLFETIGSCDKRLSLYKHGHHELLNDKDQDHACFEILSWIETRL